MVSVILRVCHLGVSGLVSCSLCPSESLCVIYSGDTYYRPLEKPISQQDSSSHPARTATASVEENVNISHWGSRDPSKRERL